MGLAKSEIYRGTIEKAYWSHSHNRSVFHINEADIALARLFTYAYRSHTIGTFSATRRALQAHRSNPASSQCSDYLDRAAMLLQQLETWAVALVPSDFRALVFSLYYYDLWSDQVLDQLEAACVAGSGEAIEHIKDCFLANLQTISTGNGIYIASSAHVPEQASFVVPNLNIIIVPLVYGDHHSWNLALLKPGGFGVPLHRHCKGVEIHLGYSPVKGRTFLGSYWAEVNKGYAMPIPPMTDHGFQNLSDHEHVVPFIFGSLSMGGWGIFFDVDPSSRDPSAAKLVGLDAEEMNATVLLERAIRDASTWEKAGRQVLIPAARTYTPEVGGLELAVLRVQVNDFPLTAGQYKIISVQTGRAKIRLGDSEAELKACDHVGIPAGIPASIRQLGDEDLVILEALLQ
jgi:hypothetical protein